MSDELNEILDAIGGMCIQYGAAGLADSAVARERPKHRALLLDILFRQLAADADPETGLIDEECVSAQEHAIDVLQSAGLVDHHVRQRWWNVGKRDQRPAGFYLKWAAHKELMATGVVTIYKSLTCPSCGRQSIDITAMSGEPARFSCSNCGQEITAWQGPVPRDVSA